MQLEQIIHQKRGTIVDVRTRMEFQGGHVPGSVNIPLQEMQERMPEILNLKSPLILCCASGGRSGMATQMLKSAGVECLNGGSWLDVNYYYSQTKKDHV